MVAPTSSVWRGRPGPVGRIWTTKDGRLGLVPAQCPGLCGRARSGMRSAGAGVMLARLSMGLVRSGAGGGDHGSRTAPGLAARPGGKGDE